jgi:hypothetical protein
VTSGHLSQAAYRRRRPPVDTVYARDVGHGKRWTELSKRRRALILTAASVELALTATAAVDLLRRPADQVRGNKALWWFGIFVQPVGPVAYLTLARRASSTAAT